MQNYMKNYIVLLIMVIVLSNNILAQEPKEILPVKKNELSVDLIPLVKIFSDMTQRYNWRGTLQYKRQISNHLFYRFGITAMKVVKDRKYSTPDIFSVDSINNAAQYHSYDYKPELQFNTGIEYRWGKKRIKQFTGLDIGYGNSETVYTEYYKSLGIYNSYNPEVSPNFELISTVRSNNDSIIRKYSLTKNKICFTPFYGVQYHFSNRFLFTMQLGIQIQYVYGRYTNIVNESIKDKTYRKGEFDIERILNNFSLAYRF